MLFTHAIQARSSCDLRGRLLQMIRVRWKNECLSLFWQKVFAKGILSLFLQKVFAWRERRSLSLCLEWIRWDGLELVKDPVVYGRPGLRLALLKIPGG